MNSNHLNLCLTVKHVKEKLKVIEIIGHFHVELNEKPLQTSRVVMSKNLAFVNSSI